MDLEAAGQLSRGHTLQAACSKMERHAEVHLHNHAGAALLTEALATSKRAGVRVAIDCQRCLLLHQLFGLDGPVVTVSICTTMPVLLWSLKHLPPQSVLVCGLQLTASDACFSISSSD